MKFGRIFIFMLCQILFLACADAEGPIYTEEELRLCFIEGHITDQEGGPIEKIRITIEAESCNIVSKHYTSSAGFFHCDLELPDESEQMVLDWRYFSRSIINISSIVCNICHVCIYVCKSADIAVVVTKVKVAVAITVCCSV